MTDVTQETEFTNQQVNAELITTQNLTLIPLAPNFRKMNIMFNSVFALVVALIFALFTSGLFFELPEELANLVPFAYGAIILLSTWAIAYHYFADPLKQYALREHDINYQSGLIFKSLVSQPILRIQHVELKRGPIERKFGLATLQVFSAGGVSYTFYIPGLEFDKAVKLREFILDHKDLAADV